MGVQGLWQLLNPTGRPVSLQSLEGKILAIDVSIWLHQAVKGMRDRDGNPLPNAHLQVLFNRLCKLLYYRIKPVFVFDGGVPVLKKQTMAARREKKEFAELESDKATKNLVQNLLKSHAIKEVLKTDENRKTTSSGPKPSTSKSGKPDLFELPPLPEEFISIAEETRRTEFTAHERMLLEDIDLNQIDIESDAFKSLPAEMKHEVLTLMKEKKKRHTWNQILELPQESNDFSKFQMQKLMKQNKLSSHLAKVEKEMNDNRSGDITSFLGDDFYSDVIETRKIMSEDSAHSVLIKGLGSEQQKQEMERIRLELEAKKMEDNEQTKKTESSTVHNLFISEDLNFVEIRPNKSDMGKNTDKNILIESEKEKKGPDKFDNSSTDTFKDAKSERQSILKELQQRMDVLKDDHLLEKFPDETENDVIEKNEPTESLRSCVPVEVVTHVEKSDEPPERLDLNYSTDIISSPEKAQFDENKLNITKESDKNISHKKMENSDTENNTTGPKPPADSNEDLVNKRQSILDELRQKVTTLSANVELDKDLREMKEEENMQIDKEKNDLEMKQVISENRKILLRKQLSLEEEQATKRPKLDNVTEEDTSQSEKPAVESSSDSEDEGFIEVTVDIDKVQPDDLFPAEIFQPNNISKNDSVNEVNSQHVQVDEESSDSSPDEEMSDGQDTELRQMDVETHEIIPQNVPDKYEDGHDHTDLVDQFRNFTENDVRDYQENLEIESQDLQQERGKQERLAASITDQMYTEAQELLELFGVPYLISPMEAEAQCAQLDLSDLTQGTITDDSDIWLFGGKRVYKNFFNQDKHVEFFTDVSIKSQLGLGRDILIQLAFLCGSDYTPGIQGVGPITAMELLTEFPGEGLDGLKKFKKWWDEAQSQLTAPLEAKIKSKLRKLEVPEGFPNEVVVAAYMNPEVDDSQEKFSWGQPELDLIRLYPLYI